MIDNRLRTKERLVLAAIFLTALAGGPALLLTGAAINEPMPVRVRWTLLYSAGVVALSIFLFVFERALKGIQDGGTARRYLALAGDSNSVAAAERYVRDWHRTAAGDFTRSEEGLLITRVMEIFGLSEETAAEIAFTGSERRRWNPAA